MIVPEQESVVRTISPGAGAYGSPTWVDATGEAVLGSVACRDEEALAAAGLAYGLAYRILGERGAAKDVVQDSFLGIWRRAGSFESSRGSARRWLLAIVHHRAINRVRGVAWHTWHEASLEERDRDAAGSSRPTLTVNHRR